MATPRRDKSELWLVKDHLDSIVRIVNTSGTIVNAQDYYAYGDYIRSYTSGSTNDKYRFTGKERDTETNYDYFGARYYDSELGRWMSVDASAGKYAGLSPYSYSFNNPLKYTDPDGNDPELVAAAAAAVAVGVGIVITATYLATKDYLEHPSTVNFPSQTNITNYATVLGVAAFNTISNLFSSDESNSQSENGTVSNENSTVVGQTYDGRPTDQYGHVLGGSGKPRVNVKKHSTEKSAKDAARQAGKGKPVKHTSPKKGGRHYHPANSEGKKIPGSEHHEY